MDQVLQGLSHCALAFIHYIVVLTKTNINDHVKHIKHICDRLRKHQVKLKMTKCNFARTELDFLGYKISKNDISPDSEKVRAIGETAAPNMRQVRSFIGTLSYYRRFIRSFSEKGRPPNSADKEKYQIQMVQCLSSRVSTPEGRLGELNSTGVPKYNKTNDLVLRSIFSECQCDAYAARE